MGAPMSNASEGGGVVALSFVWERESDGLYHIYRYGPERVLVATTSYQDQAWQIIAALNQYHKAPRPPGQRERR